MSGNRAITMVSVALTICGVGRPALPSSIVVSTPMEYASHGVRYAGYQQFDPALGPLREVDIAISGTASSDDYTFTNVTPSPITFTGTVLEEFHSAGATDVAFVSTFTETLAPYHSSGNHYVDGKFVASASYTPATIDLSQWVGTGLHPIDMDVFPGSTASASDPGITVEGHREYAGFIDGTETVTYLYGTIVPEPSSVVMLSLGLAGALGMAWLRRAA